jgi:hypothetical protein
LRLALPLSLMATAWREDTSIRSATTSKTRRVRVSLKSRLFSRRQLSQNQRHSLFMLVRRSRSSEVR